MAGFRGAENVNEIIGAQCRATHDNVPGIGRRIEPMQNPCRGIFVRIIHKKRCPAKKLKPEGVFTLVTTNSHEEQQQFVSEPSACFGP